MTERLQVDLRPPWISLAGVAAATLGLAGIARLMVGNGPSWWRPVSTVAMAVFLQAFPFVVLGVAISAALTTLVPAGRLARLLPRSVWASVPMAAAAGAVLPGCECGSVPAARRLMQGGIAPGAALAFALAAPAINPVVLVATAVAFPANPEMVVGRALGASLAAIAVGWAWTRVGRGIDMPAVNVDASLAAPPMRRRFELLRDAILEDLALASGYLVIGAILVAVSQRALPPDFIDSLGGSGFVAVAVMAAAAVLLSICSEADAFIVAGLVRVPLPARLVFLTVGPMVDLKLIALHVGTFGRSFAVRFIPLTLVAAIAGGVFASWVVL